MKDKSPSDIWIIPFVIRGTIFFKLDYVRLDLRGFKVKTSQVSRVTERLRLAFRIFVWNATANPNENNKL